MNKTWTISSRGGALLVKMVGRVDSFNFNLFTADLDSFSKEDKTILFDVDQLEFISLKALLILDSFTTLRESRGFKAVLIAPSEKLKRQIDIYTSLENWEIFRCIEDYERTANTKSSSKRQPKKQHEAQV